MCVVCREVSHGLELQERRSVDPDALAFMGASAEGVSGARTAVRRSSAALYAGLDVASAASGVTESEGAVDAGDGNVSACARGSR